MFIVRNICAFNATKSKVCINYIYEMFIVGVMNFNFLNSCGIPKLCKNLIGQMEVQNTFFDNNYLDNTLSTLICSPSNINTDSSESIESAKRTGQAVSVKIDQEKDSK